MKNIILFSVLCICAGAGLMAQTHAQNDSLRKSVPDSLQKLPARPAVTLTSVTVSGRKPVLERRGNRTVVNVESMFSGAGTDALRLLETVPGVTVDEEGNISLNGKQGVLVMIDNKPTYLSGDALANYLRSIPSSSLDKIELMPTPPANFDAAGKAGVIHFTTKRNRNKGFHGNLSVAANQGVLFSTTNSLNLNYQYNKLYSYANISYVTQNRFNDLDLQRNYHDQWGHPTHDFIQNSYLRRKNQASAIKAGMDFSLNKRTTLGYGFSFLHRPSKQTIKNASYLSKPDGTIDSTIYANNHEEDQWNNKSFNLNFRRTIGASGSTLTADADFLNYRSHVDQGFVNTTIYPNRSVAITEEQTAMLPSEISIAAGKLDFTTFISKMNLQAGVKSSRTITSNAASFYFVEGAAKRPDYEKTNDFRYRENIHAAYVSVEGKESHFSWRGGLRMETTRSKGHQLGNPAKPDSSFTMSYTNLFPTFFVSYTADTLNKHQFTLSYGRRIERPFYQDINPYVTPLDKFTLYVGNPFLKPCFAHELSLSYTLNRNLVATATYTATNNVFMEAIELNGNTYVSRTANLGKNKILGFSVNAGFVKTRWWSTNVYAEVQHRQFEGLLFRDYMDTSAVYFGINITNQFQLGSGWSAELSGSGRSSYLAGQVSLGSLWQMNTGVQKKLFNSKASIRLSVRDIFYSGIRNGAIHYLYQAGATFRNRPDLRIASLSFSYNFGKSGGTKRSRSTGSAEEEQGRIRQA